MLDVSNFPLLKKYLLEQKVWNGEGEVFFEHLAGGVSNTVIKITLPNRKLVLKQALHKLKVKEDWFSDVRRIIIEQKCLKLLNRIIPGDVPKFIFEDEENLIFIMSCAPEGSKNWKEQLLNGDINPSIARSAANALVTIHNSTHNNQEIVEMFENKGIFIQLRIDPYFRHLQNKHGQLKKVIEENIERCLSTNLTLVTGDYSPKNILVFQDQIILLDFEVAHYGDPTFDIGFLTNHILLKTVKNKQDKEKYLFLLKEIVDEYFFHLHYGERSEVERNTIRQLALLFLARVDGKSPAEYITDEQDKALIRKLSYEMIFEQFTTFDDCLDLMKERVKI